MGCCFCCQTAFTTWALEWGGGEKLLLRVGVMYIMKMSRFIIAFEKAVFMVTKKKRKKEL